MTAGRRRVLALLALATCAGGAVAVAAAPPDGRIGPDRRLLGNGRALTPYGRLTRVGNFPTGAAPTPDGRFYWTLSTGRGVHDVQIVSVRTGKVVQRLVLPGLSGGIAMDPRHPVAYVSGIPGSTHKDTAPPAGAPGAQGDVVHVLRYDRIAGTAKETGTLAVPPPPTARAPQAFPPRPDDRRSWPDRLSISPDGRRLLVPLNLASSAAIVETASGKASYVETGNYPYAAAILRDGRTGLVSNETPGTVSVVDLLTAKKLKDLQVGPHLSHPEGIAVDPRADRAYVAIANSDQVAVINTRALKVERTLSVERPDGIGAAPVDLTVTPDGRRLLVANSGTDAIAVFALPAATTTARRPAPRPGGAVRAPKAWTQLGRIPTADYPAAVDVAGGRLLYLAAKSLGVGPNPNGPNPTDPTDSDDAIGRRQYLPLLVRGAAAVGRLPTDRELRALTAKADRQSRPSDRQAAPAGTPLRAGGPIRHVFYVVRENRTYDQILGDDARGDGDPKLTLFGEQVSPNAHALARRFPLLDHVYANSEASIDGHFWTSAGKVSDYVHKNWFHNYGGRARPYDFGVYAVTWPANGFLFDQAERQRIGYQNFGEAIAGNIGLFPDEDRTPQDLVGVNKKFAKSDLGANGCFANDSSIGTDSITGVEVYDSVAPLTATPGATSRFSCLQAKLTAQIAAGTVPALTYVTLTNDHTRTLEAGQRTPRSMVADNDEALGRLVDLISHSSIWNDSAIFVVEDDSQDGADHVDAHRIPAFAISPYAKAGAVVHRRYDFLSVIRSIELITGMKPLGLWDAAGVPMYDAFGATPDNGAPYTFEPSRIDLTERNPGGLLARQAARLPKGLDAASQADMDRLLWQAEHGPSAEPPPPGPNAEGLDPRVLGG